MTPDPVPTNTAAGRVADFLFERLRTAVTFASVIRDRGERQFLTHSGGPGGAVAFSPAEITLERGLLLVQFEGPDYQESVRIRPGRLTMVITAHAPRGRGELLTHYLQVAADTLTPVSTILAGDPQIQVWHDRQTGGNRAETDDYVVERFDHQFLFQRL